MRPCGSRTFETTVSITGRKVAISPAVAMPRTTACPFRSKFSTSILALPIRLYIERRQHHDKVRTTASRSGFSDRPQPRVAPGHHRPLQSVEPESRQNWRRKTEGTQREGDEKRIGHRRALRQVESG